MVNFAEMDAKVTLFEQLEDQGGPVVLINKFNVDPGDVDSLIQAWMLMPSAASSWNIFAAMPACERIPRPTIEIFTT